MITRRHELVPGSDLAARRALARRRRRRRIRIIVAWSALGAVVLGVGIGLTVGSTAALDWGRTHTSLFEVRQIDVSETRWVPPWEVVNASEVNPGDDILALSLEDVAAKVERHPRVVRASIERTWTRRLRIEVEEKPPVALWMGKTPMEVASDGTLLGTPPIGDVPDWPVENLGAGKIRGIGLPLLTGVTAVNAEAGMVLSDPTAREALEFLARLRYYGNGGESWISEVWAGEPRDLVVITLDGAIPVKVGDGRLSRKKLSALHSVLERVLEDSSPVEFLDARFRHQVIVKTS